MQFVNQKKWFYKRFVRNSKLIKLGFRNLYIFPNLFGIYWILSIAVIYILGINLENEFTIFICYLMITVLAISLFLTHFNLHGLVLISTSQEINFANSIFTYKVILDSKKYRYNIRLKLLNKENEFICTKAFEGKIINYLPSKPKKRGIYKPDIIYGESCAPFSLFNCWFYWRPVNKIIIAPERKRGKSYYEQNISNESKKYKKFKEETGEELLDLELYKKGDKKSLIYWKSLARSQNLLSKNLVNPISKNNWLILNRNLPLKNALEHLCFDIHAHYSVNHSYGVRLSKKEFINPDKSRKHYFKCLKLLAGYKYD